MSPRQLVLEPRLHLEDVEFIAADDATWPEVCRRTGFSRIAIEKACQRAHRGDILARINTNAKGTT